MKPASGKNVPRTRGIILFLLLCALPASALASGCAQKQEASGATARVYFLNASANMIEPEDRAITGETDAEIANNTLSAFMEGPRNKNLTKTYPDNLEIRDKIRIRAMSDDAVIKTMEVDFSPEYRDMTPIQELFFRASFVWTMTELPFIANVQIYVDGLKLTDSKGEPIGLISRDGLTLNPSISPIKTEVKNLTLYFADESGGALIPVTKTAEVNPDTGTAFYVIKELIAGPGESGGYPVLPPDIKLRDVKTEDGVCYVSLSPDFLTKAPSGACLPAATVWAIVNSLTELEGVTKVKFLADSESVGLYRGTIDLSKALERDETLIPESGR